MRKNSEFMRNFKICILLAVGAFVASCSEDDKLTVITQDTVERGAILRTISTESSSFDIFDPDAFWGVTIEEQDHEDGDLLSSVDVFVNFVDNTAGNGTTTTTETMLMNIPASAFSLGVNGLPRTSLTVTFAEALAALGLSDPTAYDGGDQIAIRLLLNLTDGRSYTDVDATGNVSGGSFFSSPYTYRASLVCPTALAGTHSFVSSMLVAGYNPGSCPGGTVSGTVTWTDLGGGTYQTSDLGFGQYESTCWSDSPATSGGATFVDACGLITSGGTDQYGLVYIWVITDVSGPDMTITWTNDYADSGTTVLTREGGADWPALFTN